jgi:predicted transcriptional regulator
MKNFLEKECVWVLVVHGPLKALDAWRLVEPCVSYGDVHYALEKLAKKGIVATERQRRGLRISPIYRIA